MGGCTTYVVRTIIQKIKNDYAIIGYPRLVRLNPNIPWKTRGNGALCFCVGKKVGTRTQKIGEINGGDVFCASFLTQELDDNDLEFLYETIRDIIKKQAQTKEDNTNPGFVILATRPKVDFYKKAVTGIVSLEEVLQTLQTLHARFEGYKNQRGLIGATAAIAWEPKDWTFEVIAYRTNERWGTKRMVDPESVKKMDAAFLSTFDNYDYQNHHNRIVPNSPCPILFGIRGDDIKELLEGVKTVQSEPIDSWIVFESNQGTDDHIQQKQVNQIQPFESVIVEGKVIEKPWTIQGGHVLFNLSDETGTIPCAAYEPTKEFRAIIRGLHIGDVVEAYGGVREHPLTINLEKIFVKKLTRLWMKTENPLCPVCCKHMKSKGAQQGYKCSICKTKSTEPIFQEQSRSLTQGFYEVPVCARRHLSKPLKRLIRHQQRDVDVIGTVDTP
jgi:tRNA(Ile2)-agmatinylcytidine synthase